MVLLEKNKQMCFQDRRTALHWACSAGHTNIVEFLLDLGVEVNLQDDVGGFEMFIFQEVFKYTKSDRLSLQMQYQFFKSLIDLKPPPKKV